MKRHHFIMSSSETGSNCPFYCENISNISGTITLTANNSPISWQYTQTPSSTSGWTTVSVSLNTSSDITIPAGAKYYFKNTNTTSQIGYVNKFVNVEYGEVTEDVCNHITFSNKSMFRIGGNIASLMGNDFETTTMCPIIGCFAYLFDVNFTLIDAGELIIPFTTSSNCCYKGMFEGNINLKTAPKLPGGGYGDDCFTYMFNRCMNLTFVDASNLAYTENAICYFDENSSWLYRTTDMAGTDDDGNKVSSGTILYNSAISRSWPHDKTGLCTETDLGWRALDVALISGDFIPYMYISTPNSTSGFNGQYFQMPFNTVNGMEIMYKLQNTTHLYRTSRGMFGFNNLSDGVGYLHGINLSWNTSAAVEMQEKMDTDTSITKATFSSSSTIQIYNTYWHSYLYGGYYNDSQVSFDMYTQQDSTGQPTWNQVTRWVSGGGIQGYSLSGDTGMHLFNGATYINTANTYAPLIISSFRRFDTSDYMSGTISSLPINYDYRPFKIGSNYCLFNVVGRGTETSLGADKINAKSSSSLSSIQSLTWSGELGGTITI